MRLNDLENKQFALKALAENYELPFNLSNLDKIKTQQMLKKVRNSLAEARHDANFHKNQTSPSYMKMVFMEQALASHYQTIKSLPQPRIMVENEEVEKSQVVLAAQDMVDSIQKMLEETSDMMVKELPALVNSIQSEIGVNESEQFNTTATESLGSLISALTQSKTSMQGALNVVTGQGSPAVFDAEPEMGMGDEEVTDVETDIETDTVEPQMPEEEPEAEPVGGVGREKR